MSPSDIYHQSSPDPVVSILIFTKRLKKIIAAGGVTDKLIDEALYSSVGDFKRRHATRKTLVNCDGVMLDLQECYRSRCMVDSVKYSNFRSRVVSLQNRNALDSASLDDALRYARADWMSFYGGGRHKSFIYTGCLYADQIGKRFHSVSSFLKTVGRHDERSTIWARLKLGWDLDFALEAPTLYSTTSVGCIYKITRRSTDQIYVGLTFGDVGARWLQHVNSAIKGGKNRLAQAIRQDGPDGFFFVILEDNHKDIEELISRERYWIKNSTHKVITDSTQQLGVSLEVPREEKLSMREKNSHQFLRRLAS